MLGGQIFKQVNHFKTTKIDPALHQTTHVVHLYNKKSIAEDEVGNKEDGQGWARNIAVFLILQG